MPVRLTISYILNAKLEALATSSIRWNR